MNLSEQIVFAEALRRSTPAERSAYLEEACREDPALRRRVELLLQAAEKAGEFLEGSPARMMDPEEVSSLLHELSERPGDRIGRYKLLQQIGEGGCGVVYQAEQEEPVRRRVALKVIKLGMDTRQVIARFEAERQALALMDHPHIARVLDAGATSTGRPFFVMELVRGLPITHFCDQHQLATEARLTLFIQVCQAVQHAHQKGVIHRDLKPSNILVADHDGVPVPKVIDFGIAKATDQRLTEKTVFTALEQFLGTPVYMSPEQASLSGLDIDTRTDVYSLGVLLYELLTGRTPFDAKLLLQAGLDEMRRTIREQEPMRPSTRLGTLLGAELSTTAGRRRVEPVRLIHLVRGDLDWIVMKCLEKDRTRRYDTASALGADLQRHLGQEPVWARPPTFRYRAGKWMRKHKGPAIAALSVMLALCAGLVASTVLYWRERKALAGESAQRAKAETETKKSLQTARFLTEMLSGIDPTQARGRDVSVLNEMLEQAAQRVETEFKDQPEVEASVRTTIGHVYRTIASYAKAQFHLERAREIRERVLGPEHPETLSSYDELVDLCSEEVRPDPAVTLARKVLDISTRVLGPTDPKTLARKHRLASACADRRDFAEAERLHRELLEVNARLHGSNDVTTLKFAGSLASTYLQQRKFAQAEALHRQTLEGLRKVLPPEHPGVSQEMANLAASLHGLGRLAEAESLYRETWEAEKRVHGPEHPKSLVTMQNLASLLFTLGRTTEAEALSRQVVEIARRTLGPEHPRTLRPAEVLAVNLGRQGKYAEAEPIAREVLTMSKRVFGPEDPRTLRTMGIVAGLVAGRPAGAVEAEQLYQDVLSTQNRLLGPTHQDSLQTAASLLALRRKLKNFSAAEKLCRETLEHVSQSLGRETPVALQWKKNLKDVLKEAGRSEASPTPTR